jgi:iron(III) transport system ATP-binding protein
MAERITVDAVCKIYPGGNQALHEVSLAVEPGTFLVLLGPSGSGKTTLLRMLAGIERITSGRITLGDAVVADGRVHVPPDRRDLSMVFQDYALWPHLTVRDNVAFALRRRRLTRAESRGRAHAMLERVGLGALTARYPNELSGGEQQRVALARALVADTGLILCDEPLSNLDADLRERMRVEISSLVRDAGATTLYITHDRRRRSRWPTGWGCWSAGGWSGSAPRRRSTPGPKPRLWPVSPGCPASSRSVRDTADDEHVEVEPAGGAAGRPFRARRPHGPMISGDGLLLIRPTGVRLTAGEDSEYHLAGTVADVAFRGRGYEHAIDVPGHGQLTGVFSPIRAGRGEQVGLYFEPDGCHVFAPPEAGQPEPAPAQEASATAGPAPGPPGEASPAVAVPWVG